MIAAVLAEAGVSRSDIDLIACGRGPGAFTGVRISVAVAQGLGLGLDRPVLPVSGLMALAEQAYRRSGETQVLATLDARMGEVYAAAYRRSQGTQQAAWLEAMPESLGRPTALALPSAGSWYGMGSGFSAYPEALEQGLNGRLTGSDASAEPVAEDILRLAVALPEDAWCEPALALPVYLRDEVADPSAWRGPPRPAPSV